MEKHITSGVIGGVVGGVVFGIIMNMMGMMPMIAKMVGMESAGAGWVIHFIISAGTGALFAYFFSNLVTSYANGAGYGLLYGVIWWVLGALILMPVILGMGVQIGNAFDPMRIQSLMGHGIFGLLLGVIYVAHSKKGSQI
jgi:hypothetical protein